MGQPELFLEFKRGEGRARHLRVTQRKIFVIGSSKSANLRIGGADILGCHAALQFIKGKWILKNLSVDGAEVLVNGKPVVEAIIDETAEVTIGGNRIDLFSKKRDGHLFQTEAVKAAVATGPLTMHQIVVTSLTGNVIKTVVLTSKESFRFNDGERTSKFAPPASGDWIETTVGKRVVRQRLVSEQGVAIASKIAVDGDMKKPVIAAVLLMLLMLGTALLIPKPEPTMVALDQKSIDMILNADAIKKKRVEAKKVTQAAKQRAGGSTEAQQAPNLAVAQPDQSMAPVQSAKATAALTSIRNSGLSALIGKIAKRANKNGIMIAAQGTTADNKNAGRAFFSNGTTTTGGGGAAATAGNAYRLGGIATRGKGGGATGVRDGTGLAGGTVGTGDVAMVDEETVIEGGLDRDVIADVIRRNLGQIRYCYERQLSSNPELYGKLLVKFTINAGGSVMEPKIDNTTLKSAMVEGCVLRRMAGWKFPLPKGGTQVRVSYPFLFKALD